MTEAGSPDRRPGPVPLSVVIATWNRRDLVGQAIDSVMNQQFAGPLEIIVVDDGSTDCTLEELASSYGSRTLPANRRLSIHSRPHRGISGAKGSGIQLASGDYVAMCNHDDLWEPTRAVELLAEVARTPNMVIHTNLKMRMLDGFKDANFAECDDYYAATGLIPTEYPGNVTLRDFMLGRKRPKPTFDGATAVFPRRMLAGEYAMPAGLVTEEVWLLFCAIMQGGMRYANHKSYVARVHGQNESLLLPNREANSIRGRLTFLEHALPILGQSDKPDSRLLRRLSAKMRAMRCQLALIEGGACARELRNLSIADAFLAPREVISLNFKVNAPSVHRLWRRVKKALAD